MTGIETAIIVIAFVIAASVFAFAILNMGLLTTSKAQEAIVSGVSQAQSSMKITSVYAYSDSTGADARANGIVMIVQPSGTASVDFGHSRTAISYKNENVSIADVYTQDNFLTEAVFSANFSHSFTNLATDPVTYAEKCWIIEIQGDGNKILDGGEIFAVYMNLTNIDATYGELPIYKQFTTEIVPGQGSKLTFSGTMPSTIDRVMVLTGY